MPAAAFGRLPVCTGLCYKPASDFSARCSCSLPSEEVHVSERSIEDAEVEAVREREGLPSNYRMRADRHYVDQLAAPAAGQPVRMLPIAQVDLETPRPQADLRPLIESVRV